MKSIGRERLREACHSLEFLLIDVATGGVRAEDEEHQFRRERGMLLGDPGLRRIAPIFLKTCRSLGQFWAYVKKEHDNYAERREHIYAGFAAIHEALERSTSPVAEITAERLVALDSEWVVAEWSRAVERARSDPEGAITLARTLVESVCKHILEADDVAPDSDLDLPALYGATANHLGLHPRQHDQTFRQFLSGCFSIINGLAAIRNATGDAHGKSKTQYRPAVRHAEFVVNIAGSVAAYVVATWERDEAV